MTSPARVVGFLDLGRGVNSIDFSVLLVMGAAVLTATPLYMLWTCQGDPDKAPPLMAEEYSLSSLNRRVDVKLLSGAAIFGVGWGLIGLCPGPALVSLGGFLGPILLSTAQCVLGSLSGRHQVSSKAFSDASLAITFNTAMFLGWFLNYVLEKDAASGFGHGVIEK